MNSCYNNLDELPKNHAKKEKPQKVSNYELSLYSILEVKKIFGKREQIGGFPGKKVMVAGGK
jgi:hypothetical protein